MKPKHNTTDLIKVLALSAMFLVAAMAAASAEEVVVLWDKNPENNIIGYELHIQTGETSRLVDVKGDTKVTVNLERGDVIKVRAYNSQDLRGPWSDTLTYTPPGKPGGLKVKVVEIQTSSNLTEWQTIALVPRDPANKPAEFVRARVAEITR